MMWTIANAEARYMFSKVTVKLSLYNNGEGGAWYATVDNDVQHEHVIELDFGIEAVSELVAALMSEAKNYDTIAMRCKRTAERHAAIATSVAFSEMAANITRKSINIGVIDLQSWLLSQGF